MVAKLLRSFHRALITATVVFASVYIVLALWRGGASRADAEHLDMMMAQSMASHVDDRQATVSWGDLMRHGERNAADGTSLIGRMEGQRVRMAGYMVPLDGAAYRTTEFLLVPYYGACIHVPPPPPHQIVHAKAAIPEGFPLELQKPVWVEGIFSLIPKQSVYGEASFSMEVRDVRVYEQ